MKSPQIAILSAIVATVSVGCGGDPRGQSLRGERTSVVSEAVLGPTTFKSCADEDIPHLETAFAYGRIASNSPAFQDCINTAFNSFVESFPPQESGAIAMGPYIACNTDPPTPNASTILTSTKTANPTAITCNYNDVGTSTNGYAGVGGVPAGESTATESIGVGDLLSALGQTQWPCYYNKPGGPCVSDTWYARTANTIYHEIMHQHGYNHYEYSNPPFTCGLTNSEIINIPSPYDYSVNYMVGSCIQAVLEMSATNCSLHSCGPTALSITNSVFSQSQSQQYCTCVSDPKPGGRLEPGGNIYQANSQNIFSTDSMSISDPDVNRKGVHSILTVTQNWNPYGAGGGVYNNHNIGVWYGDGTWNVFNQDYSSMPAGAFFNVSVDGAGYDNGGTTFIDTATSSTIAGNYMTLNTIFSDPNQVLIVTPNWNPSGGSGIYNNHPTGVWWTGSVWSVYNEDMAAMPVGATFNVRLANSVNTAYVHYASSSNVAGNYTILDNPALNGQPGALVFVTHVWNPSGAVPTYLNHPIGVWYTGTNWSIFNEDLAAMPTTAAFNVMVGP